MLFLDIRRTNGVEFNLQNILYGIEDEDDELNTYLHNHKLCRELL